LLERAFQGVKAASLLPRNEFLLVGAGRAKPTLRLTLHWKHIGESYAAMTTPASPSPALPKIRTISPTELHHALLGGACLIDVREPIEFEESHVEGAKLVPLGEFSGRLAEIPRDRPVVVMCRGGKRGASALGILQAAGYSQTANLEGGLLAWQDANLPLTVQKRRGLPLMQQVQITIGLGVLSGVVLSRMVDANWIFLSAFFGAGLVFAGSTGWCGLAILLSKMPWNRPSATSGKSCCS
jgi:rhodanese-related sulfurtransferase